MQSRPAIHLENLDEKVRTRAHLWDEKQSEVKHNVLQTVGVLAPLSADVPTAVNVRLVSGPRVWSRHALPVSGRVSCVFILFRRLQFLPKP